MLNKRFKAGSQKSSDPRLIEEIVKDYLANSNSPFAVAYRQQQAEQAMKLKVHGRRVNTELCVNLKTRLLNDAVMKPGKPYQGFLTKDVEVDEFFYDEHFTFVETAPPTAVRRNPRVINGRFITVTRRPDGSYRANLKPVAITDRFDFVSYATAVGNELLWALEGLVGEER